MSSSASTSIDLSGVLVVGGGYAGVHAARAASRDGVSVTVLEPTGHYDFVPRLAAVAGGTAPVTDAVASLHDFVDAVVPGRAVAVDDGEVTLDDGRVIRADAVVVTTGSTTITPDIAGLEHAHGLRDAADAVELRSRLETAARLVVVGGGATGVQLAGAASVAHPSLEVAVVETGDRLLEGFSESLGRNAARILSGRGVSIHTGRGAVEIDERGVVLDDGSRVDGVVAWTVGFEARADELGLPVDDDGRLAVDDDLRVRGTSRTFAAGDVAGHRDRKGRRLAMSAQIAVQAGSHAGHNAARTVRGQDTRPASLRTLGYVLDLGGDRGLASFPVLDVADPPFDLLGSVLHLAIDLKHLTEIGGIGAVLRHFPGATKRPVPITRTDRTLART